MNIITYDLNNKEESQTIEDYYFFKYYSKTILNDWEKFYDIETENDEMILDSTQYTMKLNEKVLNIILRHLNKDEFYRLKNIIIKYIYESHYIPSDFQFLDVLLSYRGRYRLIYRFKYLLKFKFGNK